MVLRALVDRFPRFDARRDTDCSKSSTRQWGTAANSAGSNRTSSLRHHYPYFGSRQRMGRTSAAGRPSLVHAYSLLYCLVAWCDVGYSCLERACVSSAPETGSAEEGEREGRREQQALGCCVSARAGAFNGCCTLGCCASARAGAFKRSLGGPVRGEEVRETAAVHHLVRS